MKAAVFFFFILCFHTCYACTTILIGKNATKNGCVILAHNEDMGKETAGVLRYYQGRKYAPESRIKVPYIEIDQAPATLSFWGAGNARNVLGLGVAGELPYNYNHVLVGMNENGVAMACNWMNSREENLKESGIRRYAIRQLVMERARSSRDAVQIISNFIDRYGQADWGGLTYCLADSKEAWIIETTSTQWVARRIKDNEIWTVANRFTITDDYDLQSDDLVDVAYDNEWILEKSDRINFRAVYGKFPENAQSYDIGREKLVAQELDKYNGEIELEMIMSLLRHRYQEEAHFSPVLEECWRSFCEKHDVKRPLSSCLTQSSIIATLHDKYDEKGGKMWYLNGSPHAGIYFPLYGRLDNIHPDFENTNGQDKKSNWWRFRQLQSKIDENHDSLFNSFRQFRDSVQNTILKENLNFESSKKHSLADWENHQEKLSSMAVEILAD